MIFLRRAPTTIQRIANQTSGHRLVSKHSHKGMAVMYLRFLSFEQLEGDCSSSGRARAVGSGFSPAYGSGVASAGEGLGDAIRRLKCAPGRAECWWMDERQRMEVTQSSQVVGDGMVYAGRLV